MDELYFWGCAVIVGLIFLKAVPAEKLSGANKKMREKIPGALLAALYVLIGIFIFVGSYFLCFGLSLGSVPTKIITGSVLGVFIGLIPIVDIRHSK